MGKDIASHSESSARIVATILAAVWLGAGIATLGLAILKQAWLIGVLALASGSHGGDLPGGHLKFLHLWPGQIPPGATAGA